MAGEGRHNQQGESCEQCLLDTKAGQGQYGEGKLQASFASDQRWKIFSKMFFKNWRYTVN